MPDPRSVLKEFRILDRKRATAGLTPSEEERYAALRDLVGPELAPAPPRAGFDVDAAAAQLRDSLLPAGLRNRPPPPPAPPPVEAPPAEEPAAEPEGEALGAPEEAPQPDAFFEPATLSTEAPPEGYEGAQPAWDPNAAPPAEGAWDPNAAYDPNAPPPAEGAWDPNAAYDPNAPPPAEGAWDPNAAAYDPNAPDAGAAWDGSAEPFATAEGVAEPPPAASGPWQEEARDPGSEAAWQTGAYDEDAPGGGIPAFGTDASPDAGGQAFPSPEATGEPAAELGEPVSAQEGFLPEATEAEPEGWVAQEPSGAKVGGGEGAALESLLPFDAAADAAIVPGEVPEGFDTATGEYDDTAGFAGGVEAAPEDLAEQAAVFETAQAVEPEATEGWQPDAVLDEGFQLESGGSFDAAADAAAPEWAAAPATPPWEAELDAGAPAVVPPDAVAEAEPELIAPEAIEEIGEAPAEAFAGELSAEAPPEPFFAEAPEDTPAAFAAGAAAEPLPEEVAELSPAEDAAFEPLSPEAPLEPPAEDVTLTDELALGEELSSQPPVVAEEGPGSGPALDLTPGGAAEEAAFVDAALGDASGASFDVSVEATGEAPPLDLAPPEVQAPAQAEPEPLLDVDAAAEPGLTPAAGGTEAPLAFAEEPQPPAEEEIPTIEGEEILEEIPAEEIAAEEVPAAPPPPPPAASPPSIAAPPAPAAPATAELPAAAEPGFRVSGAQRVVVHTIEGLVKRGVLQDVDLGEAELTLSPQAGGAGEVVATDHVKAIFFMLAPGEKAPLAQGKRVRVTFRDGRQVAGFSPDYSESGIGFFMIPADARTNTGRIWVYRSAVRQVSVS